MSDTPATEDQAFSQEFLETADRLVRRYPVARSALLPLLHLAQSEHGYVSEAAVAFCAQRLALTKAEVGAVSTFYTMFKRKPVGDWLLSVCTNPPCQVAGAQTIYERYRKALGGELTDLETSVSIEEAECLGICDAAPVVQVNYEMYGPLTDEEADRLLDGCRKGQPPVSNWSGEPAPSFREVERELSGANDAFLDANIEASRRSVADHEVPPMRITGETDVPVTAPGGDPGGHGGEVFAAAYTGAEGRARDADDAAATVAADDLVEAQADAEADGSTLQVGEHHHPDAEADADSSGAATDITDTSLPATGRSPADTGDASVAAPDEPRPDTVTDPSPGERAADHPEEAAPVVEEGRTDLDDGAVSAASSTPTTASREDGASTGEEADEEAADASDDADETDETDETDEEA